MAGPPFATRIAAWLLRGVVLAALGCAMSTRIGGDGGPTGDSDIDADQAAPTDARPDGGPCDELEPMAIRSALVARGATVAVDCIGGNAAWSGPEGVYFQDGWDAPPRLVDRSPARAVALSATGGRIWFDGPGTDGALSLRMAEPAESGDIGAIRLPNGVHSVNDILVVDAPRRRDDVYVGTDEGTAILDGEDGSCGEGLGCWVGSPSTGYLHRPPSLVTAHDSSVHRIVRFFVGRQPVFVLGNAAWIVRLEWWGEGIGVAQSVFDLFGDREPQEITALAWQEGRLHAGVAGMGLVRTDWEHDCVLAGRGPTACSRRPEPGCREAVGLPMPVVIVDLAALNDWLVVATPDALFAYVHAEDRFLRILSEGDPIEGAIAAVASCGATLQVATDRGLYLLAPPWDY